MGKMTVEEAFQEMREALPELLWVRIINMDGLTNSRYDFDAVNLPDNLKPDNEGDRIAPMSSASISLGERINEMLNLGEFQFVTVCGSEITHMLLPIGSGEKFYMSIGLKAPVSIDKARDYFTQNNFLAEIEPLIKYRYP